MSRYVKEENCDYIIDLDLSHQNEPHYHTKKSTWKVIYEHPFLNAQHSTNPIARAFYIPIFSSKHNQFASYQLLARKSLLEA